MMLQKLLVIFVLVPAAMVGAAVAGGPAVGRWVAYGLFPVALIAFAIGSYVRDRARDESDR